MESSIIAFSLEYLNSFKLSSSRKKMYLKQEPTITKNNLIVLTAKIEMQNEIWQGITETVAIKWFPGGGHGK